MYKRCCRAQDQLCALPKAEQLIDTITHAGLLLASYWAVRYLAPAALGLWFAKQAGKRWNSLSGAVVMAATYAASMAASSRFWAGPTSTVRMHYPLFNGSVTIPAAVGGWIRCNKGLAKTLTMMVSPAYHAFLGVCNSTCLKRCRMFVWTTSSSKACRKTSLDIHLPTFDACRHALMEQSSQPQHAAVKACCPMSCGKRMSLLMCSLHGGPGSW